MIITLRQEKSNFCRDIKVNREQKITDTLWILHSGGILLEAIDFKNNRIYSKRLGEYIDVNNTYEQANIFNGDILSII